MKKLKIIVLVILICAFAVQAGFNRGTAQKVSVYCCNLLTGLPAATEDANIVGKISKDGAAEVNLSDLNPVEIGSSGVYVFDINQTESDCNMLVVSPTIADANKYIEHVVMYAEQQSIHTWYVAKTGNDYNKGHSFAAAKLTIAAAITAAAAGDTIEIGPGTYTEAITVSKALTIKGKGMSKSIVTYSVDDKTCDITANGISFEDISVTNTNGEGQAVYFTGIPYRISFLRCYIYGVFDSIYAYNARHLLFKDCILESNYDAIQLGSSIDVKIDGCLFLCDGSYVATTVTNGITAMPGVDNVLIKDSIVDISRALSTANRNEVGIECAGGNWLIENVIVKVKSTGTGSNYTRGLSVTGATAQVFAENLNIKTSVAAGSEYSIYVYAGNLKVSNCLYDSTKTSGTITDNTAAILTDTGTTLPALVNDVNNNIVADINEIGGTISVDVNDIVTRMLAATGITQGGTWTTAKMFKVMSAWAVGKWQGKSGVPGTYEILDPDDGNSVILEITPSATSPQKTVEIKI